MKLKGKKPELQARKSFLSNKDGYYEMVISDGNKVEFINHSRNFNASGRPNVTRLVFQQPYKVNGQQLASDGHVYTGSKTQVNKGVQPLYNAKVLWYDSDDTKAYSDGEKKARRVDGYPIVLGVDIDKINKRDMSYCQTLFEKLLEMNRVKKYLYTGGLVNPIDKKDPYSQQVECGNYVGHVAIGTNGKYVRSFDGNVGRIVHNSKPMKLQRKRFYEDLIAEIDKNNRRDEEQIMALQKKKAARSKLREKYQRIIGKMSKDTDSLDL